MEELTSEPENTGAQRTDEADIVKKNHKRQSSELESKSFQGEIMVIDDSKFSLKLASRIISTMGYDVSTEDDPVKALSQLRAKCDKIRIIFMDVAMPKVNGMELLQRIKAEESLKSIPVYMVSALDDDELSEECLKLGAVGTILKPLNADVVQSCLSRVFTGMESLKKKCKKTTEKSVSTSSAISSSKAAAVPNRHVLVVDDSTISGLIAKRSLQKNGFECTLCKNGLEGIAALKKSGAEFSAVIVDLDMPKMGGVEMLSIMQKSSKLQSIPAIVLAGTVEEDTMERCKEAGAHSVLVKPFPHSIIAKILRKVCGIADETLSADSGRKVEPSIPSETDPGISASNPKTLQSPVEETGTK